MLRFYNCLWQTTERNYRKRRIFNTPEEENRNMISLQISNICSKEILIKEKICCMYISSSHACLTSMKKSPTRVNGNK